MLGCIWSHQYGHKTITWSAPAVCLSASLPYHYGRLINKHELIQEKREPRYEHQICQSGTIFRQQMMLSFEGDLPETRLWEKRQNRPHQPGCNNNGRCVASVWQWQGNSLQFTFAVIHLCPKTNDREGRGAKKERENHFINPCAVLFLFISWSSS